MVRPQPVRALVTGATGFVGSRLVRQLVADGWDVHVLMRPSSSLRLLGDVQKRVRGHVHDGRTESLTAIVGEARPDVVFHLAALFLAQHAQKDIVPLLQSNVVLGTQLLEAMTANDVHALVNAGTAWQHYNDAAYAPVCLYAATKQAFEDILQFYVETTPLRAVTLQFHDTYGPGDPRPKLFALLRSAVESGEPLAMSPGEQHLDLVHVEDAAAACRVAAARVLDREAAGHERFVVSSARTYSLREVVRLFEEANDVRVPVTWGGRPYRPREVMRPWAGGASLPDWQPRISLVNGLKEIGPRARATS